jgi:GABA(A) receptor-associated protein
MTDKKIRDLYRIFSKKKLLVIIKVMNKMESKKTLEEANRVLAKYPDRIPVYVEVSPSQVKIGAIKPLDKNKFLVPVDLSMGQFMAVIRKRMKLEPAFALFAYVDDCLISTSSLMGTVYNDHKDETNFLTIIICTESTFGKD